MRFSSCAGENGYGHQPAPLTGHVARTLLEALRVGRFRLDTGAADVVDALIVPPLPTSVLPPFSKNADTTHCTCEAVAKTRMLWGASDSGIYACRMQCEF